MFYFQAKKKKKSNKAKPMASPIHYRGSPQILKIKKKKKTRESEIKPTPQSRRWQRNQKPNPNTVSP